MSRNKIIKRSLYILTEGHTEQAYFSRISEILGDEDEWKYSVTVEVREIIDGSKTDPVNMVKEAKQSQKDYDEVWVVFDKDRDRDSQNILAIQFALKSKIKVAFSSIAFEEWVLLHFEKCLIPFERSDCESRGQQCTCNGTICASTYIKLHHYPAYVKGKAKLFDELRDRLNIALEFAAWLKYRLPSPANFHLLNPYTDVDNLVSQLLELPAIRYAGLNTVFFFDEVGFTIVGYSIMDQIMLVSIQVSNNSQQPFLFNNMQSNIALILEDHSQVNYTIHHPQIINSGENRVVDIQFPIDGMSPESKVKFQTHKEWVYVELLPH